MKLRPENLTIVGTRIVRGRPHTLWSDGTLLPVVRGGDGPVDPPAPTPPAPVPPAPTDRTFTQEEVNRMLAAEKAQGQRAGETSLLTTLGVTDAAEAKRILDAQREAERGRLSDAERAKNDADAAKAAASADRAAAAEERRSAAVERALVKAGLVLPEDDKQAEAALTAAARLVMLTGEPTADAVSAAVGQVKTQFAALFQATTPTQPLPGGDPLGRSRSGGGGGKTGIEAGRELARKQADMRAKAGNPLDRLNVVGRP